jgi:hypothetical protein
VVVREQDQVAEEEAREKAAEAREGGKLWEEEGKDA